MLRLPLSSYSDGARTGKPRNCPNIKLLPLLLLLVGRFGFVAPAAASSSSSTRSVYISRSGQGIGEVTTSTSTQFNFLLINGGSEFFDPVQVGWGNACRDANLNCQYYRHDELGGEDCLEKQIEVLEQVIYEYQLVHGGGEETAMVDGSGGDMMLNLTTNATDGNMTEPARYFFGDTLDGIALGPCDADGITSTINAVVEQTGIPVVLFDTDATQSKRAAYIGTDNVFMGVTMAKVLKQLRPEGGTFAVITPPNGTKPNIDQRYMGFKQEITRDNDKEGKAHWFEIPDSPLDLVGRHTFRAQPIVDSQNPTALVTMYLTAMRGENWTSFIDHNRPRGIIYVGSDGSDFQLDYLNKGYVDGLVGQLPYDMGRVSLEVLHELMLSPNKQLEEFFHATNLVSYTLIPLELPPLHLDENLLGNLVYVGYACFGIIVVSAIICSCWTIYYRNALVVKSSQPFFLFMITFGVIFMASALIPLSFEDDGTLENPDDDGMTKMYSIGICMSIPWLAFLGMTVTFAALFSKTWRVNRLFHNKVRHARIEVSVMDVLSPFVMLLSCNVIVLLCWSLMDPLTYIRQEYDGTDYWNRVIATYGSCRSENVVPFVATLAAINFSVIAMSCYQAYQARDIKSEFAEAKFIGLAVFSFFQAFLTGIPVLIAVKDMPQPFYLTLTMMIFLICVVLLWLIFLPKMKMQSHYSNMSETEQRKVMSKSVRMSSVQSLANVSALSGSQAFRVGTSAQFKAGVRPAEQMPDCDGLDTVDEVKAMSRRDATFEDHSTTARGGEDGATSTTSPTTATLTEATPATVTRHPIQVDVTTNSVMAPFSSLRESSVAEESSADYPATCASTTTSTLTGATVPPEHPAASTTRREPPPLDNSDTIVTA